MQVEFEVTVFTDNGLEFEVEIGFYYKLPREFVGKIYDAFSKNYHGTSLYCLCNVCSNIFDV